LSGPVAGTYLAFDFGSKSIGVAAGSRGNPYPTPLAAVRVLRSGPDWERIDELIEEWNPAGLVVGLAYNAEGGHTPLSRRAQKFGCRLRGRYNRPVHWIDETLSTEAARHALRAAGPDRRRRKEDVDNAAAALILESFLNAQQ